MIKFALSCDQDHQFESWFPSAAAYETQRQRGLVTCPVCGSGDIDKAMMAPQVARKDRPAPQTVSVLSLQEEDFRRKLRELHQHVKENATDVGKDFAEEARKIHFGEAEKRTIYGQTSFSEARELHEEGIEVFPLPALPQSRN